MTDAPPRAVILGCAGTRLSDDERAFFRAADPVGFILFRRNVETPAQVKALVAELRETIGRPEAPVLIDQEGGRVARLQPPHWRAYPSAAVLAGLGEEAVRLGARLIADDLARLDITVDCVPCLDIPATGADPIIGDRAYGNDPETVARLGRVAAEALLEGGVLPVVKHIPGHGRGTVDSHLALPVVDTAPAEFDRIDMAPFKALADMPWAMTAHIVYSALDETRPATLSPIVIAEVIRNRIGFDGVLVSDDLSMKALGGGFAERATAALDAGCDLVLHCNGDPSEMAAVVAGTRRLTPESAARLARGEARRGTPRPFDRAAAEARFESLIATA
jgi:beta-N-acetylhexosaminidase